MAFWDSQNMQLENFRPGILSRAEAGDNLIMAFMHIDSGKQDSGHSHHFDQCGVVLEGQIEMFIGDEKRLLKKNDGYFIPAGENHGWKTLQEPVKIIDVSAKRSAE